MTSRALRLAGGPLWALVALTSAAGLLSELAFRAAPSGRTGLLLTKFSLSYEANVPTWLATSLLLACALAAGAIAQEPAQLRRRSWMVVTTSFAWASLDEAAELHEHLGGLFGTGGILYFDWVISAAALLVAVAVALWPWLRELPRSTRRRMLVAGGVYFGGALVMELPLGWWTERFGAESLGYALIDWVEETLELVGAVLMLRALLLHATAAEALPQGPAPAVEQPR